MSGSIKLFTLLWLLVSLFGPASAQEPPKFPNPDKVERGTTTDDKGMVQWETHTPPKCANCSGTGKMKCPTCARFQEGATFCVECKLNKEREVPCHVCAGAGTMPDPLDKVACPCCHGAAFLPCQLCGGGGKIKITGGGDTWQQCPPCGKDGGFKCTVCNGTRLVDGAGIKPPLKDAPVAALTKAIAAFDQSLKSLSEISPAGGERARKEVKGLVKAFEPAGGILPAIKRTSKALEEYMNKVYGGSGFMGHEENEAAAMSLVKTNAEYYLKHQKRMFDLALKRAEANAKVAAEQKGK